MRTETTGFAGKPVYQDTVYDARGLKIKANMPYFKGAFKGENANWLTYKYDNLLRLTRQSRPSKTGPESTSTEYDRLTQFYSDYNGNRRATKHNVLGQVTHIAEGSANNGASSLSYSYDALGQLVSSNANGIVITQTYDDLGNKTQISDPSLGTRHFTYTGFGEVKQQTDAKGQQTRLSYDALGRMTQSSDASQTSQYLYDQGLQAKGKLNTVTTRGSAVGDAGARHIRALTYNAKGLTAKEVDTIDGKTYTTAMQYDDIGRVIHVALPDEVYYLKEYANGKLHSIQVPKVQIWDYYFEGIDDALVTSRANIKKLTDRIGPETAKALEYAAAADKYRAIADNWLRTHQSLRAESMRKYAGQLQALADYYYNRAEEYRGDANIARNQYSNIYFKLISTSNGWYNNRYIKKLGCADRTWYGRCTRDALQNHDFSVDKGFDSDLGASYFTQNSSGIKQHDFFHTGG